MPRHKSPKIWMPRSFLPRRIHQREGTEGTTADTAQGPHIRGLIAAKHCTKTFSEAKNLQQLQEIDHTCRCLLFAGSAHCIPLPLKIWRRSKI